MFLNSRLRSGGNFANGMGYGGITTPTADPTARVEADDITILDFAGTGNAVHDFFIDRNTGFGWKRRTPAGNAAIIQKQGLGGVGLKRLSICLVNLLPSSLRA